MKMEFTTLLFDVRDHVAHITLNRPDAANSINEEMGKDLMHAALRCDEDPEIRAVLISGAGKIFSGGGDLKAFSAKGDQLPYHIKEITTYLHAAMSRLTRMDAPVVAAVHCRRDNPVHGSIHTSWTCARWFFDLFPSQDRWSQTCVGTDTHQSYVFCPGGAAVGTHHSCGS
jgi:hypothetical protein